MKMEEVTAMEVDEIVTRDRDDPIIKSGLASRNHHLAVSDSISHNSIFLTNNFYLILDGNNRAYYVNLQSS